MDPHTGVPIRCGFFVDGDVGVSVEHDRTLTEREVPFDLPANDSAGDDIVVTSSRSSLDLDFSILRIEGPTAPPFFNCLRTRTWTCSRCAW